MVKPSLLILCGRELPFVRQADHLGNTLTEQGDMEQDAAVKRAKFVQSSVEVRNVFKFADPGEVVKALKTYSSSFYGSCLWDLGGVKAMQVYNTWNTTVKLAGGLPQRTRTYIFQQLLNCGHTSARVDILSRFVKFFHSLRSSASQEVQVLSRFLARDVQSVTGKNLRLVQEITQLNPWTASYGRLKEALVTEELVEVPQVDSWRLPYLCTLLGQRKEAATKALEEEEKRLDYLIQSLVIN